MQNNENTVDEWISWIEEAIDKKHIKYYEYENFKNIQEIGSGAFGKVFRANWKNFEHYLALKSFFNLNSVTIKEIVSEVRSNFIIIIIKKFNAHFFKNIFFFFALFLIFSLI